jgi:hypothetical protein
VADSICSGLNTWREINMATNASAQSARVARSGENRMQIKSAAATTAGLDQCFSSASNGGSRVPSRTAF